MKHLLTLTLCLWFAIFCTATLCVAADPPGLPDNQRSKESYSLGFEFGNNLKRFGVEIDAAILFSAIKDGLEGKSPALTPDQIKKTILEQRKRLLVLQNIRAKEYAAKNLEESKTFLSANKNKEGVITLSSGLQYKVLRDGDGPSPAETDTVTVNYRGTLMDGTEFDNSQKGDEPAVLPMAGIIKGWSEALQLMKTGSKWQLFIPPELAYGPRQLEKIPPNSVLIFDIELVKVARDEAYLSDPESRLVAAGNPDLAGIEEEQ